MKSMTKRKLIAALGAATLVVTASVAITPSASAAPVCATAKSIETCTGTLTNGAGYLLKMPVNFKGTMYFWEHGVRPTYPGIFSVPTGVEEIAPASVNKNGVTDPFDISKEMLQSGKGLASYDGTVKGMRGWNVSFRVEMIKELIDITTAKYPQIQKKVLYGSSGAGGSLTEFVEKYPTYADSVGLMAGVGAPISVVGQSGCDLFYLLSVFADPTIKGCAAMGGKGAAGWMAAVGELQKAAALLTAWSQNLGAPGLEYPAALKGSGIPQRSALLLMGLLGGVPTKSLHMDGISTNAVIAEHSINATVAILENFQYALGTTIITGNSIGEMIGPGFYDNTKTNYSALLDEGDAGRYNLGLSGDDGINAMLGVLAMAPRVTGNADTVATFKAMGKVSYSSTLPTILLHNEADRLVQSGNTAYYVDKKREAYEAALTKWEASKVGPKPRFNTLAIYALTPETYTKFTAAGLPDLTGAGAVSGVEHQSFTKKQMLAWVGMLDVAAKSGKVPTGAYVEYLATKVPYLNGDLDFRPNDLKHYNK
jgi:hypothetical protein